MARKKGKWAVWVHPKRGDDFWYDYPTKTSASEGMKKLKASKKYTEVEPPVLHYKRTPR